MRVRHLFDRSLWIFLAIGLCNTLLSQGMMQGLYGPLGYWGASAVAFAVTSVISFVLNKRFSFENKDPVLQAALRFALVIAVCYGVAYALARPAAAWILTWMGAAQATVDRVAMLVGQVLFTGLNYLGQRFFAFRKK